MIEQILIAVWLVFICLTQTVALLSMRHDAAFSKNWLRAQTLIVASFFWVAFALWHQGLWR